MSSTADRAFEKPASFQTERLVEGSATPGVNVAGVVTICGGMLLHFVLGTIYCWGNFNSYTPAYMKNLDGEFDPAKANKAYTLQILPFTFVFQAAAMPVGAHLMSSGIRPPLICFMAGALCGGGLLLASFTSSLGLYMCCYCGIYGSGIGLGYTIPIVCGVKHFPNSKGLVSGLVLAAFGLGGLIFNTLGSRLFNPEGLKVDKLTKLYPESVTENFSSNLRLLGFIYFVIASVASPLVRAPVESARAAGSSAPVASGPNFTVLEAIKTKTFWLMWVAVLFSGQVGLFVASKFKALALESDALNNDAYLSMVASLGSIANGLTRPLWGMFYDRVGFKVCFSIVASAQAVIIFLLPRLTGSAFLFCLGVMSSYAALAGNMTMCPPESLKLFGNAAVYGCLFAAFACAGVFGVKIADAVANAMTDEAAYYFLVTMAICALIIVQFHVTRS